MHKTTVKNLLMYIEFLHLVIGKTQMENGSMEAGVIGR